MGSGENRTTAEGGGCSRDEGRLEKMRHFCLGKMEKKGVGCVVFYGKGSLECIEGKSGRRIQLHYRLIMVIQLFFFLKKKSNLFIFINFPPGVLIKLNSNLYRKIPHRGKKPSNKHGSVLREI